MIITNSYQLHDHLSVFMEEKMCFRKLKTMILLHKQNQKSKSKIKSLACFRSIFYFELKGKSSRAEPS